MPYSNACSEAASQASALAVACASGYEGELSGDPEMDKYAISCAEIIAENACSMWVRTDANGGFVHRDGRHKPLQEPPINDTVSLL